MSLRNPLNKYINHTLLTPDADNSEFERFLDGAIKYQFPSICIPPHMVTPIVPLLRGMGIKIETVVGFPHGNSATETKLYEAAYLSQQGADVINFVINYGDLKSGLCKNVGVELESMDATCQKNKVTAKCIIETCYLTEEEKTFMYKALNDHTQIGHIKTSTGFGTHGALLGDVMTWNEKRSHAIVQESNSLIQLRPAGGRPVPISIEASAGIEDLETALKFIAVGADSIGMSNSVEVMEQWNAQQETFTEREETA